MSEKEALYTEGAESKDEEVRSESGISVLRRSERKTEMTEKGKNYWKSVLLDNIKRIIRTMNTLQSQIKTEISKDCNQEIVRKSYKEWLAVYDNLFEERDNYVSMLTDDELAAFEVGLWSETVSSASYFKSQVEDWSSMKSSEHLPSVSGKSRGSSVMSALSSAKMKERQARAELEAQEESLKKKHELQMAQLKLKLQEEELDLQTKIAIVEAKTKIIEEEMANAKLSEEGSSCHSEIQSKINKDLNLTSQVFMQTDHRSHGVGTTDVPISKQDLMRNVKGNSIRGTPTCRYDEQGQSSGEIIMQMVKQMRKPPPDIKPFAGDPLQYRKFFEAVQVKDSNQF
ncbi:uncharacterized protein LOC124277733 [Haliotis rubra]|uniref:uncharacterized protein LOC124277733 n=1 Tax=Haliotis rubra TaxID=36100 RepID=UPI001EE55A27|nr:uncharacterized protein LOC124277733 [Haliotis rubra]